MTTAWTVVVAVGAATILIKAAGPALLGGRPLPDRLMSVIELLAPAVLAALVVTQAVGGDHELVFDSRLIGLAAGAVTIWFRAPVLVTVVVAAATTALWRAFI